MVAVSGVMEVALAKPLANVEASLNTREVSEETKLIQCCLYDLFFLHLSTSTSSTTTSRVVVVVVVVALVVTHRTLDNMLTPESSSS